MEKEDLYTGIGPFRELLFLVLLYRGPVMSLGSTRNRPTNLCLQGE